MAALRAAQKSQRGGGAGGAGSLPSEGAHPLSTSTTSNRISSLIPSLNGNTLPVSTSLMPSKLPGQDPTGGDDGMGEGTVEKTGVAATGVVGGSAIAGMPVWMRSKGRSSALRSPPLGRRGLGQVGGGRRGPSPVLIPSQSVGVTPPKSVSPLHENAGGTHKASATGGVSERGGGDSGEPPSSLSQKERAESSGTVSAASATVKSVLPTGREELGSITAGGRSDENQQEAVVDNPERRLDAAGSGGGVLHPDVARPKSSASAVTTLEGSKVTAAHDTVNGDRAAGASGGFVSAESAVEASAKVADSSDNPAADAGGRLSVAIVATSHMEAPVVTGIDVTSPAGAGLSVVAATATAAEATTGDGRAKPRKNHVPIKCAEDALKSAPSDATPGSPQERMAAKIHSMVQEQPSPGMEGGLLEHLGDAPVRLASSVTPFSY